MNAVEIIAILAMTGYAIYKQTQVSEVRDKGRFKLALIYAIVGVAVGGFALPHTALSITLLAVSILLSVVVGVARGYLTKVWVDADGSVLRQGTALTVGLFLGLVAVKFGMGTWEYFEGVRDTAGFGEIMVMIAVMVAAQAEIVRNRARALTGTVTTAIRRDQHVGV
ncbi:MAG TPA: hypothetical protein PLZ93_15555 [Nocardioides sp.]|uniref:hypothetical protein n=1 Tax=uncultured Nocardioides sp. TaxID=198441 RepID=UPI000EDF4A72|nr:hypothetical protein [uncultured Nocardioides sp.]HCB05530.1 DUF1453 domain-containing protein [Nocardioides sp.]HRD60904.1 hypothetical protein [Nocardioides sp.]HRI97030.1 hypothetical protein [Nocardioides sp.]HRK45056.1 hypothetical protein [Nocardioides sp.]